MDGDADMGQLAAGRSYLSRGWILGGTVVMAALPGDDDVDTGPWVIVKAGACWRLLLLCLSTGALKESSMQLLNHCFCSSHTFHLLLDCPHVVWFQASSAVSVISPPSASPSSTL
jgi:hypothetical protein